MVILFYMQQFLVMYCLESGIVKPLKNQEAETEENVDLCRDNRLVTIDDRSQKIAVKFDKSAC